MLKEARKEGRKPTTRVDAQNKQVDELCGFACVCARKCACQLQHMGGGGMSQVVGGACCCRELYFYIYIYFQPLASQLSFSCGFSLSLLLSLSPSLSLLLARTVALSLSCLLTHLLSLSLSPPPLPPPSAFVVAALCRAFLLLSVFLSSLPASTVSPPILLSL